MIDLDALYTDLRARSRDEDAIQIVLVRVWRRNPPPDNPIPYARACLWREVISRKVVAARQAARCVPLLTARTGQGRLRESTPELRTNYPDTALRTVIAREELAKLPAALIHAGMGYRLSDNPNTHRSRVRRMREASR